MKTLIANDAQALIRQIYEEEGLDRNTATLQQKHDCQRLYMISRNGDKYTAVKRH